MKLSLKAIRFVIEALDFYLAHHDHLLDRKGLTDEEVSDLANDRQYLQAIKQDFEKYRDELAQQRGTVPSDA
jgi:hypothetical protein